jgi:hypothetical protein
MEVESENGQEQSEKAQEYATAKEKQLRALEGDESWICYFECKICFSTVTHSKANREHYAENIDPNVPHSGVCKSCLANQNFQNSLPMDENLNQGTSSNRSTHRADDGKDSAGDSSSSAILSPLTTTTTPSSNMNISIKADEDLFQVGKTHRVVLSAKPPAHKTGNYAGMNLYLSQNVFDPDFERLFNNEAVNERRLEKFYAGVDVIYKRDDKKIFICEPLLCPAKVFYDDPASLTTECEVIVGIFLDGHNSAVPILGVYDSFRNLKNLTKSRSSIHGLFTRHQPTSIQHDFSAEEMSCFSRHLFTFLNVKSSLEEKEGKLYYHTL